MRRAAEGPRKLVAVMLALCAGLVGDFRSGALAAPVRLGGRVAPRPGSLPAVSPGPTGGGAGAASRAALQSGEQATTLSNLGSATPVVRHGYSADLSGLASSDPYQPDAELAPPPVDPEALGPPSLRVFGGLAVRRLALKQPVHPLLTLRPVRPTLIHLGSSASAYRAEATTVRGSGDQVAFVAPRPGASCGRFAWRDGSVVYALSTC